MNKKYESPEMEITLFMTEAQLVGESGGGEGITVGPGEQWDDIVQGRN